MNTFPAGSTALDLIPGDAGRVLTLATKVDAYSDDSMAAATRLSNLNEGAWVGKAAAAFRGAVGELPSRLTTGSSAMSSAAASLRTYADALSEAQIAAAAALALAAEADALTAAWEGERANFAVAQASAQKGDLFGTAPSAADPGAGLRAQAISKLADARESVEDAARLAESRLQGAGEAAPNEPSVWEKLWEGGKDLLGDVLEGMADLGDFAFRFTPLYALRSGAIFAESFADAGKVLARGTLRAIDFIGDTIDWWVDPDEWPAQSLPPLGQHLPDWKALPIGRAFADLVARGSIRERDGSQVRYYSVGKQPGRGEVQVDLYISEDNSWILQGDNREPTSAREKSSRVRFVIDFETGRVKAIVFPSRIVSAGEEPAVRIDDDRLSFTQESNGSVRVDYNLVNSVTHNSGGGLLQGLEGGAIQGEIKLSPRDNGAFDVITDRDDYPSLEVYQYAGGHSRTLAREGESYMPFTNNVPNTFRAHTEHHFNGDQAPLPGFR